MHVGAAIESLGKKCSEAIAKHLIVTGDTSGAEELVVKMADAGEVCLGVTQEATTAVGETCNFAFKGWGVPCLLNGASVNITNGSPIKAANGGIGVKAATNNDQIVGRYWGPTISTDGVIAKIVLATDRQIGAA